MQVAFRKYESIVAKPHIHCKLQSATPYETLLDLTVCTEVVFKKDMKISDVYIPSSIAIIAIDEGI